METDAGPRAGRLWLLIAVGVVVLLAAAIVPLARWRVAREKVRRSEVMRAELVQLRTAIAGYRKKRGVAPHTLHDLVASRVIPAIPHDPVTGSDRTWRTIIEESVRVEDFKSQTATNNNAPGIVDVRSGASGTDAQGRPWNEY
jgi:type II secretory pathway pseudopilin PulG